MDLKLHEAWKRQLTAVLQAFLFTGELFNRYLDDQQFGLAPHGSQLGTIPREAESSIYAEYMRALWGFRDLVRKGAVPPKCVSPRTDDGHKGTAALPITRSAILPRHTSRLTRRELEVLTLIAAGETSRTISAHLGIAFKTTACHRTRIMEKLGCHNAADLTRAAIRMGLLQP
jgi:DNA-binding CsgD family transcriptional regulator